MDVKYTAGSTIGYTLPPVVYKISDIILILKFLLPGKVKIKITIDDTRLKSNLTTNKTIRFPKNSFFYTILGITVSQLGILCDIPGFVQLIPGSYKSNKPIDITGIDEIHL